MEAILGLSLAVYTKGERVFTLEILEQENIHTQFTGPRVGCACATVV